MGLLRTAIVVGAVVALMPTDRAQQMRIAEQAAGAARWTLTFCDRNAATCAQAVDVWGVFVKKAQFAGQLAIDLVNEHAVREAPPQAPAGYTADRPARVERGTLTPQDLKPSWRGTVARQGA